MTNLETIDAAGKSSLINKVRELIRSKPNMARIPAAAGVAAVLLAIGAEVSSPGVVGEGQQTVTAGSVDEALGHVEGIGGVPKDAARELVQPTSADGTYVVPDSISTNRDLNPFNNGTEWREGPDSGSSSDTNQQNS